MERIELIKQLEDNRQSRVITYLTSDRSGPVNARVAMDIIPIISKQLRQIGHTNKIDLFLYSAGGDTMVPWRLVSMIREYCHQFSVLIPYKAHSAATMISLGADHIVMSDLSELSPIDPSTANVFNPVDPHNPQNRIPISVEDVIAYFDLAKKKFGITDDEDLARIFLKFMETEPAIHPLALGNINRIHTLIRLLAKQLLQSHQKPLPPDQIERIVEYFTEKLYSHQYFIGRREAKESLGLQSVEYADKQLSILMTALYDEYKQALQLENAWNPDNEIGLNNSQNKKDYTISFIESREQSNLFNITIEYRRQPSTAGQQTPQEPLQIPQEHVSWRILEQGWQ